MWTVRQYLSQFGNPNHVINGFGPDATVDLDSPVREVTWGTTAGSGVLQHWCHHGVVILKFSLATFPEHAAYLAVDDGAGQEWEFARLHHIRRFGNDYRFPALRGVRPFAVLRLVMGELATTKKQPISDSYQSIPVAHDLPDLT